jgi:hypothetical protein
LLFKFALEYTIRKAEENLLVYADNVNLLREELQSAVKNTQTLLDASKEAGLEENGENYIYAHASSPQFRTCS